MTYPGGKNGAGVFQTIINRIPVHHRYIEPFAGSAAVFRHKAPAASSLLIELDPGQAEKLAMLEAPACTVKNADGVLEILSLLPTMGPDDFVYMDPPYVHATRRDLSIYRHEWDDRQHRQLLDTLLPAMTDRGVRWMLSGYRSELYDDASSRHGWLTHDFTAMTRRGPATETLWMNYDPARSTIAETTYAGSTFRERERIKRKATRWVAKLNAMPPLERQAILTMLASAAAIDTDGGAVPRH